MLVWDSRPQEAEGRQPGLAARGWALLGLRSGPGALSKVHAVPHTVQRCGTLIQPTMCWALEGMHHLGGPGLGIM